MERVNCTICGDVLKPSYVCLRCDIKPGLIDRSESEVNVEAVVVPKIAEEIINKYLPDTFYAGLNSEERLKMLVKHWQRAIEVNHQLEEKISNL